MMYKEKDLASLTSLITKGTTPTSLGMEFEDTGIPFVRVNNIKNNKLDYANDILYISSNTHEKLGRSFIKPKDVLISIAGSIGRTCVVPEDAPILNCNQAVCIIRCNTDEIFPEYLNFWLNSKDAKHQISSSKVTGVIQNLSLSEVGRLRIPLPPLEEQRRIASILDKADDIRQKRQQAIAKLDELLLSEFLKKFSNKNFKTVMVQELLETEKSMRTGPFGSQLLHSEFVDEGIAVLGIDNAVKNQFQWGKPRFITEQKYKTLSRYTVQPNDVLITIMGTCGRCAVVPEDIPKAINTKHLCCITLDKTKCEPEFLHSYFLMHPTARNYLESRAKGAIMDGLNMGIIKELPVELPSLEDQKAFLKLKKAILSQKQIMDLNAEKIDQMFGSLQQKAFSETL